MRFNLPIIGEVLNECFRSRFSVAKNGGTLLNNPSINNGAEFDGISNQGILYKDIRWAEVKDFSISFDTTLGEDFTNRSIFASDQIHSRMLRFASANSISSWSDTGAASRAFTITTAELSPGDRVTISYGYDHSTATGVLFINKTKYTTSAFPHDPSNEGSLQIGRRTDIHDDYNGTHHKVRFFNRLLTDAEFEALHDQALLERSLSIYLPLRDKRGVIAPFTTTDVINGLTCQFGDGSTASTNPTPVVGEHGLDFDGGDRITVLNDPKIQHTSAFHVGIWIKGALPNSNRGFITKNVNNTVLTTQANTVYEISYLNADGNIYFQISDGTTKNYAAVSAEEFFDNEDHLLVADWDGAMLRIYKDDGQLVGEAATTIESIQVTDDDLWIGNSASGGHIGKIYTYFSGEGSLTPAKIKEIHHFGHKARRENSAIRQKDLVFDINPTLGHFQDASENENDASQSANSFIQVSEGWASLPTKGALSISHDESQNVSELAFMIRADFWREQSAGDRMLYKAGAYDFYFAGPSTIAFSDGTTAYSFPVVAEYIGAKTIGVKKPAGLSKAQLWIDGKFVTEAGGSNEIGTSSNPLYIGNALGVANKMNVPIMSAALYSNVDVDMTELHEQLIERRTFFVHKRAIETPPSVGRLDSGMGFNAVDIGGKIIDQGPNGYDGQIYSDIAGVVPANMMMGVTPWGEPCLLNEKGTGAHINFGAAANVQYSGADTVFGYAQWFKCSSNGAQMLISRSGNYFLQKISAGNLQLSMGSGAWTIATSPVRDDVWHLYSFFVDENYEYIYIDGEEVGKRARTGTPGGGTLRVGQYVIPGFDIDGGIGPQVFYKAFNNLAEYEAELKAEWNRVATKPLFHEDFSDAPIGHVATTDAEIPGTDWRVAAVGGRIVHGINRGEKALTGGSLGSTLETNAADRSFGTFICRLSAILGSRNRVNLIKGAGFFILDAGGINGTLSIITSTGGTVFSMDVGSLPDGDHVIKIVKKASKNSLNLTVYLNDELATPASGYTNPCTDLSDIRGKIQLAPYGSNKNYGLTQLFGDYLA